MNFIEQLFGVAPDGGNGSIEAIVLLAAAFVAAVFVRRRFAAGPRGAHRGLRGA